MNRRDFLKRSALAGAGVAMASTMGSLLAPTDALAVRRGPGAAGNGYGSSCILGAHAEPKAYEATQKVALQNLEAVIGSQVGIMRRYAFWDSKLPDATHTWAAETGRTPYISLHSYYRNRTTIPWATMAGGSLDEEIRLRARSLRDLGYPLYFGFHHEPENDTANGTPEEFRSAWTRVRGLFDEEGATNITWVVALMASTFRSGHGGADLWLPPADTYDLVGVDGYNRWPLKPDTRWKSFADIFRAAQQRAVAVGKGLFIGEYGTIEQTEGGYPGDPLAKANWLLDAASTMERWPEVVAAVYSHAEASFNGMTMNYWIDSSQASADAYREIATRSYFRPGSQASSPRHERRHHRRDDRERAHDRRHRRHERRHDHQG